MKKLLLFAVAAAAVCCKTAPAPGGYTITGHVDGLQADSVWLFASQQDAKPTASSAVTDGNFNFKGRVAEPSLGMIVAQQGVVCDLIVESGDITIKGTVSALNDISVTGTPANDAVTGDFARLSTAFKAVQCHDEEQQQELITNLWKDGAKAYSDNFAGVVYTMNLIERIPAEQVQALYDGLSPKMKATAAAATIRDYLAHPASPSNAPGTNAF